MNIRTLSVIAVAIAAVASPVLAQEIDGSTARKPAHALRHYRSTYDEVRGSQFAAPRVGAFGDLGTEGKLDRSRPGGIDPDFNPAGS